MPLVPHPPAVSRDKLQDGIGGRTGSGGRPRDIKCTPPPPAARLFLAYSDAALPASRAPQPAASSSSHAARALCSAYATAKQRLPLSLNFAKLASADNGAAEAYSARGQRASPACLAAARRASCSSSQTPRPLPPY